MANAKILYTDDIRASTGPMAVGPTGEAALTLRTFSTTRLTIASDGDATFTEQAFSAATSSGDASSTLTTKGYVDSLITGATIYRGTWDPDVSLNSGYGSPDLSGVTQTSGYYYICSADGAATPNGATTEPNTWNTGDWVIWNDDIGTSGEWQKIDNSSVLSGVGTGQTVALWEGASSVTDSETLGNAPITVSGNNTTFAGDITFGDSHFIGDDSFDNLLILSSSGENVVIQAPSGNSIDLKTAGGSTLNLDSSQNATFAGDVTVSGGDITVSNAITGVSGGSFRVKNNGGTTIATFADNLNTTFAGDVTIQSTGVKPLLFTKSTYGDFSTNAFYRIKFQDQGGVTNDVGLGQTATGSLGFNITAGKSFIFNNGTSGQLLSLSGTYAAFSSSKVGIGTTTPAKQLVVRSSAPWIRIEEDSASNKRLDLWVDPTSAIGYIGANQSAQQLSFQTGNTDRIRILNNGNVGIGTTAPGGKLEVDGQYGDLKIGDPSIGTQITYYDTTRIIMNSADIKFYTNSLTERMTIESNGNVGIGTTSPGYKLTISGGGIQAGGKVTYTKSAGSLNTTGYAVAGITAAPSGNGASCGFTFTCFGGTGKYQKLVYSCYNTTGTWNAKKVIDEGTNDLDVVASANGTTITFTFKAKSSTQSYTPRVTVEATGSSINSTYA